MGDRARAFAWGTVVTLVMVPLVGLRLYVDYQHPFELGFLVSGAMITVPLALACGVASALLYGPTRGVGARGRFLAGLALGVGLGFAWDALVTWMTASSPSFIGTVLATSFVLGGACGMACGLVARAPWRAGAPRAAIGGLFAFSLALGVFSEPLYHLLPDHRALTLAVFRWTPGDSLVVEMDSLSTQGKRIRQAIVEAGVKGKLELASVSSHDRGWPTLAVVLVREPLRAHEGLRVPRKNVVYVQDGDRFRAQAGARTSESRYISLDAVPGNPSALRYLVQLDDESVEGGTVFFNPPFASPVP